MNADTESKTKRLLDELLECFSVIDSCLASYYSGKTHMYRPLAGQLRILLCDRSPLLKRLFPNMQLQDIKPIEFLELDEIAIFDHYNMKLAARVPEGQEYKVAKMPFIITQYSNGLQIADVEFSQNSSLLHIDDWVKQLISCHPCDLSIKQIIRSVADKGGGAHIDNVPNFELINMEKMGPAGIGSHKLFIIALSRFIQNLGLLLIQFKERYGYKGSLSDMANDFDNNHPSVINRAKISEDLLRQERAEYALTILKRIV